MARSSRHQGFDFRFPPILKKLKRGPQVILPKDLGMIVAFAGMNKGSTVVDAGAGSGFSNVFFGSIAKKVYSFENREEFYDIASKNIKRSGLDNIHLNNDSVFEGIEKIEEEIDIVTLDLPSPENIFNSKFKLSAEGYIAAYLPHVEQVASFAAAAKQNGYEVFVLEAIVRELLTRDRGTRPQNTGLMHTAYLVFCKKEGTNKKE